MHEYSQHFHQQLKLSGRPNMFLVASFAMPEQPRFQQRQSLPASAIAVFENGVALLSGLPGCHILGCDYAQMEWLGSVRTKHLGFVDDLAFAVRKNDLGFADYLLMSRSRIGYWDLGTNRRRITALADELSALYL